MARKYVFICDACGKTETTTRSQTDGFVGINLENLKTGYDYDFEVCEKCYDKLTSKLLKPQENGYLFED